MTGDPNAVPQPVAAPLTRAAIFLVVTINRNNENFATIRSLCGDIGALVRSVGVRVPDGSLFLA
jgi:porphyrinogen peroxidase